MSEIRIELAPGGFGSSIVLDGQRVEKAISGFTLTADPYGSARLSLDVPHVVVSGQVVADLTAQAREVLLRLGWLPPDGAQVRMQWAVRFRVASGKLVIDPEMISYDRAAAEGNVANFMDLSSELICREERTWPDGRRMTGPWWTVSPAIGMRGDPAGCPVPGRKHDGP